MKKLLLLTVLALGLLSCKKEPLPEIKKPKDVVNYYPYKGVKL